ncbi:MAG: ribonuclease HII [Alphaproteobacteria bacterium]
MHKPKLELPSKPGFEIEKGYPAPLCGVDEAGRGPIAGPVVAAAVILDPANTPKGLNDSKKLSEPKREALFAEITATAQFGIGEASVEEIDTINILQASLLAMRRAVESLPIRPTTALIDGNKLPDLPMPAYALVKGDARSLSIAAASILAKVTRDRQMVEMDRVYPQFGFARHKGYPTKAHLSALATFGLTPHHRRSFKPVHNILCQSQK